MAELLLLEPRSVASRDGWVWSKVWLKRSGESVPRGGFAGSQIPVLKQYCPRTGRGSSWHCCNTHLNLGPLRDFCLAKWGVCLKLVCKWMACLTLYTGLWKVQKHWNKRAKSRQLCTMTLLLNQSQGGWFGFIPCRKLWECHNGHGWGVGWMFCCGWCLTQSETTGAGML